MPLGRIDKYLLINTPHFSDGDINEKNKKRANRSARHHKKRNILW